jgi:hypothetical protein
MAVMVRKERRDKALIVIAASYLRMNGISSRGSITEEVRRLDAGDWIGV